MAQVDSSRPPGGSFRRSLALALFVLALGATVVTFTAHFAERGTWDWLSSQKTRLLAAELALFGILAVEAVSYWIVVSFHRVDSLQTGIAVRAIMRLVGYLILVVSVISILSSNPALAIGVGSVTGVVVAFSAQNLVGNAVAGMFLSLARPFQVGEEITVMGLTGTVTDIRLMHARLDLGDRIALIPSAAVMSQAIQRNRRRTLDWEHRD